ncbi:TIGR04283 family arsenosugar biosynthesis glycosyltransferase [Ramlibacter rhizophilus]|uniref:TIGR04283 family arsenosugar biosynthesis glycosyltransferase n=1 Tax=Ramlibacter rhizophilus TaxID=1781167 RepID=UPI001F0FC451|nr:TIGR04283 family arsenosugar biosynthesis glycosyltransferase [Ramlibacter rhizophilus]
MSGPDFLGAPALGDPRAAGLRIVIPVLDEAAALPATLRAVQPLRARGAEVVVVDGGSTDASWAIACRHADRVLACARGRAVQMNAGAAGFQGELLMFLHADTLPPADADLRLRAALAPGRHWGRFDVRIEGRHPLLRVVQGLMNLRSRLGGIATGDQAMFVRRSVFEQLGGFTAQPLMEDVDLSARLLRAVGRPACIGSPVHTSGRRWERHGVLRTIALMWWLRARHALGADAAMLARDYGYAPAPPLHSAAVAVLAKAPLPGFAKTRLIPLLGAAQAARAQRRLLGTTVRAALASRLGEVDLWCAPSTHHRSFRALSREPRVRLHAQPEGDLGARLLAAMQRHFEERPALPLLIVGTDCPLLSPGLLQAAARVLGDHDAVLVPAEDGGYVLVGMRIPLPTLFEPGIAWSTDAVAAQTRERLRAGGWRWAELPALWDVDEPADWQRWQALLTLHEHPATGTRP